MQADIATSWILEISSKDTGFIGMDHQSRVALDALNINRSDPDTSLSAYERLSLDLTLSNNKQIPVQNLTRYARAHASFPCKEF